MNAEKTIKTIPHSRPALGQEEIRLVTEAIRSGHIAQGKAVARFEASMTEAIGTQGAVACSSGTSALHLALLAMGVGPEDEVIFPSYVCLALLNAVHYVHATPVLTDIDPTTQNMDPDDVKKRLTRRTKAIIVPHMFGLAADLDALLSFGVPIIEDCAQAVGTTYNSRTVGAFGHVAVFSFYATKVITTGEGGMVLSNAKGLLDRVRDLRECDQKDDPGIRYNYKMTDMQAAMGIAQLGQLDGFIKARRSIAERYSEAFDSLPVVLPPRHDGHIYYRYVIRVEDDARPVIDRLSQKGIQCAQPVYKPLHSYLGNANCPKTEEVWRQSVSIPIYPSLSEKDVDDVADSVTETLRGAM